MGYKRKLKNFELSEDDYWKAIDFIESYGYIHIYPSSQGWKVFIKFKIQQSDVIDFMEKCFGGYRTNPKEEGGFYWLSLQQGLAVSVLQYLAKDLRTKKEIGEMTLVLAKSVTENGRKRLTPEVIAWRSEMYQKIKTLNLAIWNGGSK